MRKTWMVAAAAAATIGMIAGCSDDGGQTSQTGGEPGAATPITVGVVPVADVAPLYLGIEQGFFADEGLDVTVQNTQGAAAAVPLLLNGEMQFAYGALIPVVSAAAEGVPITFVTGGIERPASAEEDYSALVVSADSAITSAADMAGHSIGINALRAGPQLVTRIVLADAGLDPDADVEWIEIPMPEAIDAVERGDVDIAYLAEPFTSQARAAGLRTIASPTYTGSAPGATSGYFSAQQFVGEDAQTVDAFARAMQQSVDYANANTDAVREVLAEYSGLDPATIEAMQMPHFTVAIDASNVESVATQLVDAGWIDAAPDAAGLVR